MIQCVHVDDSETDKLRYSCMFCTLVLVDFAIGSMILFDFAPIIATSMRQQQPGGWSISWLIASDTCIAVVVFVSLSKKLYSPCSS